MSLILRLALAAILAAGLSVSAIHAADPAETYAARIVNFEQPLGRAPGLLQIRVTRWTPDADRDRLKEVLDTQGQKAFLAELHKLPVAGSLRAPGTAGYEFRYARRVQSSTGADGREDLVLMVDRPLEFMEFRQGWQTVDYPFTVVELKVNAQGQGDGRLVAAARLLANKPAGEIPFESYSASPYLLQNVYREE